MPRTDTKLESKLEEANERAARAEQDLSALREQVERLEAQSRHSPAGAERAADRAAGRRAGVKEPDTGRSVDMPGVEPGLPSDPEVGGRSGDVPDRGEEALRHEPMMAHLLDSLDKGKDIGHYGRLVFAMVARHFMPDDELIATLQKDKDFSEEQARLLVSQVEGKDYNPPRREKILEYQVQQDFPIIPDTDDPDCGNVYRDLKFPDHVYEHISEYYGHKAAS